MKVIGITGSSGAGKTTLSKILKEKYHYEVIDADKIARDLSIPGTEYLNKIRLNFGETVFFEDGTLNRKALAQKIYTNKKDLEILNNLTFKFVVEEIEKKILKIQNFQEKNDLNKFIVIDAPLLFESNLDKKCDCVIALIANENVKINRICKRDNITEEIAKRRLDIQQTDEYYIKKADFIIENNDESKLEDSIEGILKEIKKTN